MVSETATSHDLIARIEHVISTKCKSLMECSRQVDIPFSTLRSMLGGTEPKHSHLCKFIKTFDLSSDWLLFGEGEMERTTKEATQAEKPEQPTSNNNKEEEVTSAMNELIKQNTDLIAQNTRLTAIIDKLTK